LESYLSSSLKGQLSSSNFFEILGWSELTCFFNVTMTLVQLYMISPFLVAFLDLHSILDYCGKKYNA
jgi:hypothetical protein